MLSEGGHKGIFEAHHGPDPLGRELTEVVGRAGAEVEPAENNVLAGADAGIIQYRLDVSGNGFRRVVLRTDRRARGAEPAHVGRENAPTCLLQHRDLAVPRVVEMREAVKQNDRRRRPGRRSAIR